MMRYVALSKASVFYETAKMTRNQDDKSCASESIYLVVLLYTYLTHPDEMFVEWI